MFKIYKLTLLLILVIGLVTSHLLTITASAEIIPVIEPQKVISPLTQAENSALMLALNSQSKQADLSPLTSTEHTALMLERNRRNSPSGR